MMPPTRNKIITIHILLNISISKGNQTIEFGHLINNFKKILKVLQTKCARETSPRPFSKKSKLNISLDQQSAFLQTLQTFLQTFCFHLLPTYVETNIYPDLLFFQKTKRGVELITLSRFLSLYGRTRISENSYSRIFYPVLLYNKFFNLHFKKLQFMNKTNAIFSCFACFIKHSLDNDFLLQLLLIWN